MMMMMTMMMMMMMYMMTMMSMMSDNDAWQYLHWAQRERQCPLETGTMSVAQGSLQHHHTDMSH
jgi:hypothetical protein